VSAYLLANITVNNPENYKEYVSKVKSVVEKFGGEYLVRGGEMNIIEGDSPNERNIVIKFPSREKAMEWYNSEEYKPIRQIRHDNAVSNSVIVDGI
jgi:uncharacterized protein (DUF1330 family)